MRCRNLWWTLYIMDRHFSSSIGLPVIIKDCDTTTLVDPPDSCTQQDVTLSLQVKISQLLSTILTSEPIFYVLLSYDTNLSQSAIYKTERTQLGTFLEQTRSILHTMAGYAQEIEKIIQLKFPNSMDTMPRGTRHITLSYHQVRQDNSYTDILHTHLNTVCCLRHTPPSSIGAQGTTRTPGETRL